MSTREERRREFWRHILRSHLRGWFAGAVLSVALVIPFEYAAQVGLGWMFVGSALVVVAAGTLLAYRIKLYPFKEKRSNW